MTDPDLAGWMQAHRRPRFANDRARLANRNAMLKQASGRRPAMRLSDKLRQLEQSRVEAYVAERARKAAIR